MSHFGNGVREDSRKTPREWLRAGKEIGDLANFWAQRNDLMAFVGEGAGRKQAAALFDPAIAEIEVNVEAAFGKVDPRTLPSFMERDTQFEFMKGSGAILHEAMHAKHTTWDLRKSHDVLGAEANSAMHILEESRIEARGVKELPQNRAFLRSCALELVIGDVKDDKDFHKMTATRQAAHLAALSLARVDAGVLDPDDVEKIKEKIDTVIKPDTLEKLRRIWINFQHIYPVQVDRMYDLAREWVAAVEEAAQENGEPSKEELQQMAQAAQQAAQEAGEEFMKGIMEALGADADGAEIEAMGEGFDQQRQEEAEERAKERAAEGKETDQHQKTANEVFGIGPGPTGAATSSRLVNKRPPREDERQAAVIMARQLEKAKYRDRVQTKVTTALPPGRLRSRSAMQGAALKANGIKSDVEPWRKVQRKRVDEPKFTVGVMVDISGSMSAAMEPMATAAWVMSEATRRIQGKAAMVYYGNDVFPTLMPGEHLSQVNVYSARDGAHAFDKAFQALNGTMNLLNGNGARLLVVCSDGQYGTQEGRAAEKWLERCRRAGVAVLWLGYSKSSDGPAMDYCNATGGKYVYVGEGLTTAAATIGKVAADALTALGNRG